MSDNQILKIMGRKALNKTEWKGYSVDELRYQRALNIISIEFEKYKLKTAIGDNFSILGSKYKERDRYSLSRKIFNALNFTDYAVLSMKLVRFVKRLRRAWKD